MDDTRGFAIGGLARRAGCSVETIRYYERIGLMPPPRSGGRYRRYAAADLRRLRFLRRGRALGFTLAEMRALLALAAGDAESCAEASALAARHLATLRMKIAELSALERALTATVAGCAGTKKRSCPLIDALDAESAAG